MIKMYCLDMCGTPEVGHQGQTHLNLRLQVGISLFIWNTWILNMN